MFYEEARELLIGLEEGLMELERRQSDRAHLDRTFRAAHTLKGAAAMVGLAAIAEFTDGIESVLERIRSGGLAVDSDIITTLLEARDHLAAMVESEAARSPIPPSGELSQRLIALLRGPVLPEAPGPAMPATSAPPAAPASPAAGPKQPTAATPAANQPLKEPKPRSRKKPGLSDPEARAMPAGPRRKSRKMDQTPAPVPTSPDRDVEAGALSGDDGPETKTYKVTLTPGPDVLRRGINP